MPKIYLAIGSNVGNSSAQFDTAIVLLAEKLNNIVESPRCVTKAYGYTDQPDFLNSALTADTNLSPQQLLKFVKDVERRVGRVQRFRWGPREIDIDIIFYDDLVIDEPNLKIPHLDFANRDFVLKPLCDLNPDLVDPKSQKTVSELSDDLKRTKHI